MLSKAYVLTPALGSRLHPVTLDQSVVLYHYAGCDKTQDEPLRVTDRGAGGMALTKGRVMGEGCSGL